MEDSDFENLSRYVRQNFGINLTYKKTLVECRLGSLVIKSGFNNFREYIDSVFADKTGKQMAEMVNRLTTNHTYFMREKSHFDYFRDVVIPELIKTIKDGDMRIWSAGCSTGEEPYTLAILLDEALGVKKPLWDSKILATDISARALEKAKKGIYPKEALQPLPPRWVLNYFDMIDKDTYAVKEKIKKEVIFRRFNLMEDVYPFKKKFNVIFCRNVMIYFDQKDKDKLISKFYENTQEGGYLFIGHSETINRNLGYKYIMPSVYRKE